MPIDYSKWDKIELSDDSDVEVHPNVDKNSFIRWKQQDIHQKREERNREISTLEVQIPMYEELNRRVDQMLVENDDEKLGNYESVQTYLLITFDSSKPVGVEEDAPSYNEMIEDLLIQLKSQLEKAGQDPNDGAGLRAELKNHRKKIDDVLVQQKEKLKSLHKERELHISSADIHTGFDRSFLNKGDSKAASPEQSQTAPVQSSSYAKPDASTSSLTSTATQSSTSAKKEPLNTSAPSTSLTPTSSAPAAQSSPTHAEEDVLDALHPDTVALSKIAFNDVEGIKRFLKSHTHIITASQKDSLLMTAFDAQFAHDDRLTRQTISHSSILGFLIDLIHFKKATHQQEISIVIDGLFSKLFDTPSSPARQAFESEVERNFTHIKQRCLILAQENAEDMEQEIQLKSLDDDSELVVNLPDPDSSDQDEQQRYQIFKTLPQAMQTALKTESLDAVNEVFHGMPIEEAEEILEIFDQCGVIGVQAVLENENEWRELKEEHAREAGIEAEEQSHEQVPKIEELDISTADIVD